MPRLFIILVFDGYKVVGNPGEVLKYHNIYVVYTKEAETAEYKKQKAQLEGEAKVIEAQKNKEANELISKTLTDKLLMEKFIEEWDGKLPTVTGGETMFNITSIMGGK